MSSAYSKRVLYVTLSLPQSCVILHPNRVPCNTWVIRWVIWAGGSGVLAQDGASVLHGCSRLW